MRGGCLYIYRGKMYVENSNIVYCIAEYYGGGLYAMKSKVTVNWSNFSRNSAGRGGGAILASGIFDTPGEINITKCILKDNEARFPAEKEKRKRRGGREEGGSAEATREGEQPVGERGEA